MTPAHWVSPDKKWTKKTSRLTFNYVPIRLSDAWIWITVHSGYTGMGTEWPLRQIPALVMTSHHSMCSVTLPTNAPQKYANKKETEGTKWTGFRLTRRFASDWLWEYQVTVGVMPCLCLYFAEPWVSREERSSAEEVSGTYTRFCADKISSWSFI